MTDVRDKVLGVLKYHRWNYDLVDFASGLKDLKFHRKDLNNGVVDFTGPPRPVVTRSGPPLHIVWVRICKSRCPLMWGRT